MHVHFALWGLHLCETLHFLHSHARHALDGSDVWRGWCRHTKPFLDFQKVLLHLRRQKFERLFPISRTLAASMKARSSRCSFEATLCLQGGLGNAMFKNMLLPMWHKPSSWCLDRAQCVLNTDNIGRCVLFISLTRLLRRVLIRVLQDLVRAAGPLWFPPGGTLSLRSTVPPAWDPRAKVSKRKLPNYISRTKTPKHKFPNGSPQMKTFKRNVPS